MTEPIIAGFHPDPSICRVGDTFYLVNSSFEYLPGLPVHRSTDLLNWEHIGNALTRSSQITENEGHPSSGVFAPTIRHRNGRFWIIGTNVNDIPLGRGHFLIHADDPAGPWSDPVYLAGAIGIDPDIVWDEDAVAHVTWCSLDPAFPGIVSAPIDTSTGAFLKPQQQLWQGTGLAAPEGPHLYRHDGWWYLLLAEGGTERGHTATIARARTLNGPFNSAPNNPFLTHRSLPDSLQNVGHADLIELGDGAWAAVHLGVRVRGASPGFHVNGRESFVTGIDWIDGWPVADESRYRPPAKNHSFAERFDSEELHQRWVGVGRFPTSFTSHDERGGLRINAAEDHARTLLAARAVDPAWTASVQVELVEPESTCTFKVMIDPDHWYGLTYDATAVSAVLQVGPLRHDAGQWSVPTGTTPTLAISARTPPQHPYGLKIEPDLIELAVATGDGDVTSFGAFDGRYLSTEVAGGFTGRMIGIEADGGPIRVREVAYTTDAAGN